MEIICASLETTPEGCYAYIGYPVGAEMEDHKPNVTLIVIIVISILIVFFVFMIFVYRKMVKKEMSKEMNTNVH